jgi:hypothetical protein
MAEKVMCEGWFYKKYRTSLSGDEQSYFIVVLALEVPAHFRKPNTAFFIQGNLRGMTVGTR